MEGELIKRAVLASVPVLAIAYWLFRLVQAFFYTPPPSGPASLGRAFGFLALGEIMGAGTIWYLSYFWSFLVVEEVSSVIRLIFLMSVFLLVSSGAGYLAARSDEDVGKMNATIFVIVGLFLHSIISSIAFMRSGYVIVMILSFIPFSILGAFLQLKLHTQSRQADAP